MTALLAVIAVASALTFTLTARPLVAIPGGMLATVAWWVASSAAADRLATIPAVFALAMGIATAALTAATGREIARTDRRTR